MGVRFACHGCAEPLNIKLELAGRRGVCPKCGIRFRIPQFDAPKSTPLETESVMASRAALRAARPSDQASVAVASPQVAQPSVVSQKNATVVDALGDPSISTWYVRPPSGGQYGPATTDVLRQWISEGRVSATALMWREGWSQWREAREILSGLASDSASTQNHFAATSDSDITKRTGTALLQSSDSHEPAAGMVGNPEIGKQRRERSLKRTLTIGVLSVLSVTLIIALVVVVRSSS